MIGEAKNETDPSAIHVFRLRSDTGRHHRWVLWTRQFGPQTFAKSVSLSRAIERYERDRSLSAGNPVVGHGHITRPELDAVLVELGQPMGKA